MKLGGVRTCMQSGKYCSEKLTAYIIPTDDAHQVKLVYEDLTCGWCGYLHTAFLFHRVNT